MDPIASAANDETEFIAVRMNKFIIGWYRVRGRWRNLRRLTVWSCLNFVLTASAFFIATALPILRGRSSDETIVDVLAENWMYLALALAAAGYLKFKDPIEQRFRKGSSRSWKLRKLSTSAVIGRFEFKVPKNPETLNRIREELLRCVASTVSEQLDAPNDSIFANLLAFDGSVEMMRCVARSAESRSTPGTPERRYNTTPDFHPWKAVSEGVSMVVADTHAIDGWSGDPLPPYRSVFYIPVSRHGRTFGTLTVDCVEPYAFAAKKIEIELLVLPYVALLCLTFGSDSVSYDRGYSPPRY